jgi:hypothetical protein
VSVTEVIDLCGADGFCMQNATHDVRVRVRYSGPKVQEMNRSVGRLCERHLGVIREHAAKRMKEDKALSVIIDARPLKVTP